MARRPVGRVSEFLQSESQTPVTERSKLHQILSLYPEGESFIERKYGVKLSIEDRQHSLVDLTKRHGLPPAQVLFMELQMAARTFGLQRIPVREAERLVRNTPQIKILDVRERWEVDICRLPKSERLTPELLDEILKTWPKSTPILLYCHFGVRSLDAAAFLQDRGFTQVFSLDGGIDSWAANIDKEMPRYEQAWC